jgi:hypothetical protein
MPCPYANIFGKPNTGVHSIRLFGLAVVDTVLTIIGAYLIAKAYNIVFWQSFLGLFVLGEVLHYIFGANTAFLQMINLSPDCR